MFTRDNFITIQGWMITDLKLTGRDLLIYAIIHGFSQNGETWFVGNLEYLMTATGACKNAVLKSLKLLMERSLIEKTEMPTFGCLKKCHYRTCATGAQNELAGAQNEPVRVHKMNPLEPDNNITNTLDNNNNNNIYNNNSSSFFNDGESKTQKIDSDFEAFWQAYIPTQTRDGLVPKGPKKLAKERYIRARNKGAKHEDILNGAKLYLDYCESYGKFSCSAAVFLSQERWKDDYKPQKKEFYL